ncbi:MAG: GMP synthase [glutamine-hydrolyzing] [Candidatus Binatia bacterium]|nr:MAG: GMP synthase [glutamine-hydrolyzing] [Candidatus Binatia bacterium]
MILILDFGSQYTQLIARRIREFHVYCEIHPFNLAPDAIRKREPKGIILSGGPASVYEEGAPHPAPEIFDLGIPVLGICYGMGIIAQHFGGRVSAAREREYGPAEISVDDDTDLFAGLGDSPVRVWMSHGDRIEQLPKGFRVLAKSNNAPIAAFTDQQRRFFGVQFHPEVAHTARGKDILANFLFRICHAPADWTMENFVEREVRRIRQRVGSAGVVCALSGGVDSTVTAALVHRAVGDQLTCVFVDNGVLRRHEPQRVMGFLTNAFHFRVRQVDASALFLQRLAGVEDPEQKRRIIGNTFIEVFEQEARNLSGVRFLAQGTLYPDVIESVSFKGPSATIKSHHNVGGLPERMQLELIEPLRELFKDEVRELGVVLGIPREIIDRHPFPGPGLAIRIIGPVTAERVAILQHADAIVEEEVRAAGWYEQLWQAFAVLLPVKSVGVMGDARTYENVLAVRAVQSVDGMTADWARLPHELLARLSTRLINEVPGINRVVYDISSKPPATIEWE